MDVNDRRQNIDAFFEHYSDVFNNAIQADAPDVEQNAALYSECFIGASPFGVQCGRNDRELREWLSEELKRIK
ncbi:MAG: hypothetical protein DIU61_016550 [Bacteroidota bacterium]|jgi:hypothetical protein